MPLGQHLRADQDRCLRRVQPFQLGLQGTLAGHGVTVQADQRITGETLRQKLFELFRTLTEGVQIMRTTRRTRFGHTTLRPAMVAPQQAVAAVHRLARVTARAIRQPAAAETAQHRRETAPVQEQHDLFASRQHRCDPVEQGLRHAALQRLVADIQQVDMRTQCAAGTLVQPQVPVTTSRSIAQALQRRRCRAEHHRTAGALTTHDSQVARRIPKALGLFEGRVVLFVDQHQTKVGNRGEDRRPRSEQDARKTTVQTVPGVLTLGFAQPRVHHADGLAKSLLEAFEQLRGQ